MEGVKKVLVPGEAEKGRGVSQNTQRKNGHRVLKLQREGVETGNSWASRKKMGGITQGEARKKGRKWVIKQKKKLE